MDETLIAVCLIYHGDDGEIQSLFHWSWDNPEEEGGDSPVLGAKTFHSDKRCHYSKPPKTNWIKMEPAKKDGVSGMELTWTQYTANKINIKIDDGSDKYPWVIENSLNDGHEFLPNVSSGQKVKIQPVNWCKKGDYGDPVSYLLYPYGWYGQAVAGAVSSRANTLGYTTSPSVLGISTDSTGNGSQEAPMVPDTGRDDVLYSSISLSIIGFGIHFILNEKSRKLALKGFEKKVSKGL